MSNNTVALSVALPEAQAPGPDQFRDLPAGEANAVHQHPVRVWARFRFTSPRVLSAQEDDRVTSESTPGFIPGWKIGACRIRDIAPQLM